MARSKGAALSNASRKTLLEWIEDDNGDTTGFTQPECSQQEQDFHALIVSSPGNARSAVPLQPPPGLLLAPLG